MMVSTLPAITIEIAGERLDPAAARKITFISVRQVLSQPSVADITFMNPPESFLEGVDTKSQTSLSIICDGALLFSGIYSAIEFSCKSSGDELVHIRSFDRLYLMRKQQHIRSHSNVSSANLIGEIANKYGLTINTPVQGPHWPHILQYHQSDLDFITAVSQKAGLYFRLHESTLDLFTYEADQEGNVLTRGVNLLECTCEYNGARSYRTVNTSGWNPFLISCHQAKARSHSEQLSGLDGDADSLTVSHATLYGDDHAMFLSEALTSRSTNMALALTGTADGDPRLRPGETVIIEGVRSLIKGSYMLTEVNHVITPDTGYISRFSTVLPEPCETETGPTAILGKVISVDDPQKLGRVKVSLPASADIDTEWLNVLLPAGGSKKGLIALPDVDDNVLVLLLNHDPSFGIVLGGLFGAEKETPGWGVEGGQIRQYQLTTKGGQKIKLNDAVGSIEISDSNGSFFGMNPDKMTIHSDKDLFIQAPGKKITIKANAIDFEKE